MSEKMSSRMKEYTVVLFELQMEELMPWGNHIVQLGRVEEVNEPALGLVMMHAQESVQRQVFNVGELLISESTLTVDGVVGFGMVMGNALDKARIIAMIDAVHHNVELKWNDFREQFRIWMVQKEKELQERQQPEFDWIART